MIIEPKNNVATKLIIDEDKVRKALEGAVEALRELLKPRPMNVGGIYAQHQAEFKAEQAIAAGEEALK